MKINDRMITRGQDLATPIDRLKALAPRFLQALPDTIGGVAEKLEATRREVEDLAEFAEDHVGNRGGLLVPRDARLAAWDRRDDFYIARQAYD